MNLKTIIFIGRSGCGKGTQIEQLTEYIRENDTKEIFHLEAGQRFRNFINEGSYSSFLAKRISEEGGLQPEFLSVWAWTGELINNVEKHNHLMIDGTPRRKSEALILDSALDFYRRADIDVVYINVSRTWATDRMKARGRSDDKEASDIKNRLDWFDTDVAPVLDYYRSKKDYNFHEINGEQSIEKVHEDILNSLNLN
jgi:adenylate kinase family enzyme